MSEDINCVCIQIVQNISGGRRQEAGHKIRLRWETAGITKLVLFGVKSCFDTTLFQADIKEPNYDRSLMYSTN